MVRVALSFAVSLSISSASMAPVVYAEPPSKDAHAAAAKDAGSSKPAKTPIAVVEQHTDSAKAGNQKVSVEQKAASKPSDAVKVEDKTAVTKSVTGGDAKANPKSASKTESKTDSKTTRADLKAGLKTDTKADSKTESKATSKTDSVKNGARVEAKVDTKVESKADAKGGNKSEPKSGAKVDGKNESTADAKTDAKTAKKVVHKAAGSPMLVPPPPPDTPTMIPQFGDESSGLMPMEYMSPELLKKRKADLVAQLADSKADLKQKQDDADSVKKKSEQFKTLFEEGVISKRELETAQKDAAEIDSSINRASLRVSELQTLLDGVNGRWDQLSNKKKTVTVTVKKLSSKPRRTH